MKKTILFLGTIAMISSCKPEPADVNEYANTITSDELKEKLYTYASDEFEGRETGQPGQKKAVEYLKNHYVNLDIPSPIGEGDYFQEVPLQTIGTPNVELTVNGKTFNYFDDLVSLNGAPSATIDATDIVYAGYGINTEEYSDYENLDVTGKIVVIKEGEPQNADGTYLISGTKENSVWSNGRQALTPKREAAKEKGAAAVFFMSNDLFPRYSAGYKRIAENGGSNRLSIVGGEAPIHHFMINENLGKALVKNINSSNTGATVNSKVSLSYEAVTTQVGSENVAAVLKGTEKPDEYIVISSHLDHIGVSADGQINNGADDDGSGSVAVLEIAEAFKAAAEKGHGPKRSILFLHVTGEEKGLLGSKYYADFDPIVPLENTVVDLNIDMIGRIDPKRESDNRDYVYLIGADKLSSELHNISEEINSKYTNLELDYTYNDENHPDRIYYRSDHWSFAKNNIPIIFYFNGTHDDYHRPSDTPDKIEYDLLENRTRLVFYTAWELANRENRIVVDKVSAIE